MMAASAVVFALFVLERAARQPPGDRAVAVPQPRVRRRSGVPRHVLRGDERLDAGLQPVPPARARASRPLHTGLAMTPLALRDRGRRCRLGRRARAEVRPARAARRPACSTAAGLVWLAVTVGGTAPRVDGWDLAPALFVAGLGSGLIFAPLFDIILADLDDHEVGTGSGLLNAVQQFGGALGVAVLGHRCSSSGCRPTAGSTPPSSSSGSPSGATPSPSSRRSCCPSGLARTPPSTDPRRAGVVCLRSRSSACSGTRPLLKQWPWRAARPRGRCARARARPAAG